MSLDKTGMLKKKFNLDLSSVCKDYDLFWLKNKEKEDEFYVGYSNLDVNIFVPALNAEQLYAILPLEIYTDDCGKCSLNVTSDVIDDREVYIVSYDIVKDKGYPYITFSGENLVDALFDAIEYCHNEKYFQPDAYIEEE